MAEFLCEFYSKFSAKYFHKHFISEVSRNYESGIYHTIGLSS